VDCWWLGELEGVDIMDTGGVDRKMKVYNYTVIFEPVQEGGYDVVVPAIPEICTFGETLEEAKAMAEDAIRCYLESALKEGEPIPQDKEPSVERIAVRV
jgi:predicted RNase H-like HicB family nuclease